MAAEKAEKAEAKPKKIRVFVEIPRSHHEMWQEIRGKSSGGSTKRVRFRYSVARALQAENVSIADFQAKLQLFRVKSMYGYGM